MNSRNRGEEGDTRQRLTAPLSCADGSPWLSARTSCTLNLVAAPESYGGYSAEPVARENASLLSVLRRRALIIVVVALLTGGAAAAFAITRGDTYESTSKLLFAQSIGPELQALGLIPGTPGDADNLALSNTEV